MGGLNAQWTSERTIARMCDQTSAIHFISHFDLYRAHVQHSANTNNLAIKDFRDMLLVNFDPRAASHIFSLDHQDIVLDSDVSQSAESPLKSMLQRHLVGHSPMSKVYQE